MVGEEGSVYEGSPGPQDTVNAFESFLEMVRG